MRTLLFGVPFLAAQLAGCCPIVLELDPEGADGGGSEGGAPSAAPAGGGGHACAGDWTRILGGTGANWLRSQAVAPDGSVAVTVNSTADLSLDGASLGFDDGGFVLIKLSPDGTFEWARRFGASSQSPALPVAFDPAGNVVVGGSGYGAVDLGGVGATHEGAFGYVASFAPDGTPQWVQSWGVPIESGGLANLALDGAGNIYFQGALGYDQEVLQWGGLSTTGDTFVGKILAGGTPAWVHGYRGLFPELNGLATTPDGHVVLGQSLELASDLGDPPLATPGDFDALMVELDPDGALVDARQFGDDDLQRAGGFAVGPDGARALVGTTWGTLDFGAGAVGDAEADLVFLASFDASGTSRWTKLAPNAYAPLALGAADAGRIALVVSASVAESFGCAGDGTTGFVQIELDAGGACAKREPIVALVDDTFAEVAFAGVQATHGRTVVSGYFSGDIALYGEVQRAAVWDGFVAVRHACD